MFLLDYDLSADAKHAVLLGSRGRFLIGYWYNQTRGSDVLHGELVIHWVYEGVQKFERVELLWRDYLAELACLA
jgi:hypothetical protein